MISHTCTSFYKWWHVQCYTLWPQVVMFEGNNSGEAFYEGICCLERVLPPSVQVMVFQSMWTVAIRLFLPNMVETKNLHNNVYDF